MSWIKRKLRKKIRKFYFRVLHGNRMRDLRDILDKIGQRGGDLFFVQIGGNDGVGRDPIHAAVTKYQWKGIILEPQKMVFEERLKKNYEGVTGVILENKAVDHQSGTKKLYELSISDARWATGLATFDKDTLLKHIENGYIIRHAKNDGLEVPANWDDMIKEEEVHTTSITDLLDHHGVEKVNFFHIDTEGYDFEILKMIDFKRTQPTYLYFEHQHLSIKEFKEAVAMLKQNGFDYVTDKTDTFAFPSGSSID
ncbi:MAG: FkbM family methyltransferase [Bacteroidota bacterium]